MARRRRPPVPFDDARLAALRTFVRKYNLPLSLENAAALTVLHVALTDPSVTLDTAANNRLLEQEGDGRWNTVVAEFVARLYPNHLLPRLRVRLGDGMSNVRLQRLIDELGIDFGPVLLVHDDEVMTSGFGKKDGSILQLHANAFEALLGCLFRVSGYKAARDWAWSQLERFYGESPTASLSEAGKILVGQWALHEEAVHTCVELGWSVARTATVTEYSFGGVDLARDLMRVHGKPTDLDAPEIWDLLHTKVGEWCEACGMEGVRARTHALLERRLRNDLADLRPTDADPVAAVTLAENDPRKVLRDVLNGHARDLDTSFFHAAGGGYTAITFLGQQTLGKSDGPDKLQAERAAAAAALESQFVQNLRKEAGHEPQSD